MRLVHRLASNGVAWDSCVSAATMRDLGLFFRATECVVDRMYRCFQGRSLRQSIQLVGEPVDTSGPVHTDLRLPIHRPSPAYVDVDTSRSILETGIKVVDG